MAFDHGRIALAGRERLRAKLSYTNLGFALAPAASRSPSFATSTPPRSATTCQRPTSNACCCAAECSSRPVSDGLPARPAADPPRCTGFARAPSRSPTSSRCCARRHPTSEPAAPGIVNSAGTAQSREEPDEEALAGGRGRRRIGAGGSVARLRREHDAEADGGEDLARLQQEDAEGRRPARSRST